MATSLGLSSVIAELRDALTRLPNELHTEGASIVRDRTHEAEEAIRTGYPDRTGNLRKGLKATVETPQFAAVGIVRNTAPHAYMFEKRNAGAPYQSRVEPRVDAAGKGVHTDDDPRPAGDVPERPARAARTGRPGRQWGP
jgi:hypothetical protein